jgi:hypothetical protein
VAWFRRNRFGAMRRQGIELRTLGLGVALYQHALRRGIGNEVTDHQEGNQQQQRRADGTHRAGCTAGAAAAAMTAGN